MSVPRVDKPEVPEGYGVLPDGPTLLWSAVEARLRESLHYWVATVSRVGPPHVVPRWGVWQEARFWYDGSSTTRHARNLASDPNCTLHLESGTDVVIAYGTSQPSAPIEGARGDRLSAEFGRKYSSLGYAPEPDAWSDELAGGLMRFTAKKVLAWTSFPTDVTRFTF